MSDEPQIFDDFDPFSEATQPTAEASELDSLRKRAEKAESELHEAAERVLRAQAELENFRKRIRREMDDERKFAQLPLATDLLSVADNLDRAVQHAERNASASGLLEGVKMVSQQLTMVLDKYHCRPIRSEGVAFDPNLHQAIGQEPRADLPAGSVTRVLQNGYMMHERVIRPAQVMISTPPPEASINPNSGDK
jgi:molecular chaperone GrpE